MWNASDNFYSKNISLWILCICTWFENLCSAGCFIQSLSALQCCRNNCWGLVPTPSNPLKIKVMYELVNLCPWEDGIFIFSAEFYLYPTSLVTLLERRVLFHILRYEPRSAIKPSATVLNIIQMKTHII